MFLLIVFRVVFSLWAYARVCARYLLRSKITKKIELAKKNVSKISLTRKKVVSSHRKFQKSIVILWK